MMDYWPYEKGVIFPLKGKRILFPEESLRAHSLVVGKTGTGKSSLLSSIISVYEKMGMTVIVLDPHGELWKYSSDESKIIALAPIGDEEKGYLRFNLMSVLPYRNEREKIINEDLVVHTLRDIFSTEETFSIGTWGPRVELILTLIPRLLLKYRIQPTIKDLADILLDYRVRKDFMSSLEPEERSQLYSIFSMGYEFISSTVNKIIPLISNDVSRNLFSSSQDFYDISKLKGTIYIELSGDLSPPSISRPFSIMLLYKIWNNVLLGRMRNVVLVMDELQVLSPNILSRIVAEGRKYSLWSVMATQSLSSLPSRLTSTLVTNTHNFFLFQISEEDLRILNPGREWISSLDYHSFICSVPGDRSVFSGQVNPPSHSRELHLFKEVYDFSSAGRENNVTDPERMNPAYVSQLIANGLAFISDGKIMMGEDYYRKIGSREKKGNESFYHRYLVTRAYFFFREMGYDVYEGLEYRGHRPDLIVRNDGTTRAVECEYSDVDSRKRMMEKIKIYGNPIFATFSSFLEKMPAGVDVLLIPPVGDRSEPQLVKRS